MKAWVVSAWLVGLPSVVGCALDADAPNEVVATTRQAVTYTDFFWHSDDGGFTDLDLGPSAGRACFLAAVIGDFRDGAIAQVLGGQHFWLHVGNWENTVSAWARCRPLDSGTSLSGFFTWKQGMPNTPMIQGGSCFLTRISGEFNSTSDVVQAWQNSDGQWWLGGNQAAADLDVGARCIVGEPLTNYGFWKLGDSTLTLKQLSNNNHSAACFLNGMRGRFTGGGEAINTWYDFNSFRFRLGGSSQVWPAIPQWGVGAWAGCIN